MPRRTIADTPQNEAYTELGFPGANAAAKYSAIPKIIPA